MQQLSLQTFIVCVTVTVKLAFGRVIAVTNRNTTTKTTMADGNKEGMIIFILIILNQFSLQITRFKKRE